MAGLGIALRGLGKAVKKGISKISNMSDKNAGTITMTGVGAAVVGGGELLKSKKAKDRFGLFSAGAVTGSVLGEANTPTKPRKKFNPKTRKSKP